MFLFLPIVFLGGILIYIYSNYRHLLWLKPIELKPLQPRTTVSSGFRSACIKCGSENTFLIDNQCNGGCSNYKKLVKERTQDLQCPNCRYSWDGFCCTKCYYCLPKERTKEITRGQENPSSSRTPNSLVLNTYDSVSEINIKRK